MRFLVFGAIIAVCIAGAALAQDESTPAPVAAAESAAATSAPVRLTYLRRPDARAFAINYPRRAQHSGVSGAAVLCCTVLADGHLDCTVPFEWPADYGFGEATLRISRDFQVADGETLAGGRVRNQIVWMLGERTPELDAALTRIREGTRDICGPTINVGAPLDGAVVVTQH